MTVSAQIGGDPIDIPFFALGIFAIFHQLCPTFLQALIICFVLHTERALVYIISFFLFWYVNGLFFCCLGGACNDRCPPTQCRDCALC